MVNMAKSGLGKWEEVIFQKTSSCKENWPFHLCTWMKFGEKVFFCSIYSWEIGEITLQHLVLIVGK